MPAEARFFPFSIDERRDEPVYRGERGYSPGTNGLVGIGSSVVVITDADGTRPLRHFMRHSPDGFEWGYAGSGPAELARCLLIDALGLAPLSEGSYETFPEIDTLYQRFKSAIVAGLAQASWELPRADVLAWFEAHRLPMCGKHRARLCDRAGDPLLECLQCLDETL